MKNSGLIFLSGLLSSTSFAAQSGVVIPTPSQDYLKVLLVLCFIVGLIFACAWLIRRMSGGVGINQKHLQVLSVMPLGTREKLMIIRAADEHLLIGVTPQGINTLHHFDEPIDLHSDNNASPFADRLKGLLKGLDSDPLAKHKHNPENTNSRSGKN